MVVRFVSIKISALSLRYIALFELKQSTTPTTRNYYNIIWSESVINSFTLIAMEWNEARIRWTN